MKIYLASRYSRRLELCGYREQVEALGHTVTSRWLNGKHQISDSGVPIGDEGEQLVEGDDGSSSDCAAQLRVHFAQEDLEDVRAADCVISFTEPPRSSASRGGRHVQFGVALQEGGKFLVVIGHRENIFHWLPGVMFYQDWAECLDSLKAARQSDADQLATQQAALADTH